MNRERALVVCDSAVQVEPVELGDPAPRGGEVADDLIVLNDRRADILSDLEGKRSELETLITDLRGYEHSYRTRLRAYLEEALVDLQAEVPIEETLPVTAPAGR